MEIHSGNVHPDMHGLRVQIVDAMILTYQHDCIEPWGKSKRRCLSLGMDRHGEFRTDAKSSAVYRGLECFGRNWRTREFVLAATGDWVMPTTAHPDCITTRPPEVGEVYESETYFLWLTPNNLVELRGTLPNHVLEHYHGRVVEDIDEPLRNYVFEECLRKLTQDFGEEINGKRGRDLIRILTAEVWKRDLRSEDLAITESISLKACAELRCVSEDTSAS